MTTKEIVEILAALSIPVAVCGLLVERLKSGKGIGVRAIQFIAVTSFMPTTVILAFEGILDGSTVAALVGAFIGYLFSHIAEFDRKNENL